MSFLRHSRVFTAHLPTHTVDTPTAFLEAPTLHSQRRSENCESRRAPRSSFSFPSLLSSSKLTTSRRAQMPRQARYVELLDATGMSRPYSVSKGSTDCVVLYSCTSSGRTDPSLPSTRSAVA